MPARPHFRGHVLALVAFLLLAWSVPGRAAAVPPPLLISELFIESNTQNQDDEFIRIFNPTKSAVSIVGWRLTTCGNCTSYAVARFPANATVPAGGSVVATKNGDRYKLNVDPYADPALTFDWNASGGFGLQMEPITFTRLALTDTHANVILRDATGTDGEEVDVARYVQCDVIYTPPPPEWSCQPPVPYAGSGWTGDPVQWPPTAGYENFSGRKHKVLARAIDESTITGTYGGSYVPDTNTKLDWMTLGTDSLGRFVYWQKPASPAWTPMVLRYPTAGQLMSLPLPTWSFNGSVTAFVGPDASFDVIAGLFDSAKSTIELNMYDFALGDMAQRLIAARKRGVTVRVLIEGQPCCTQQLNDQQRYVNTLLDGAGVTVRFLQGDSGSDPRRTRRYSNVDHAKYAIVDAGSAPSALIYSGNFKKSGTPRNPTSNPKDPNWGSGNREWGVIIRQAAAAAYFRAIFEHDYDIAYRDVVPYRYVCADGSCDLGPPAGGFQPDTETVSRCEPTYPHQFQPATITGSFAITPAMVPETSLLSERAILGMLKGAKTSISVEFATLQKYWGSSFPAAQAGTDKTPDLLVDEVLNAARRGVSVRVLLDGKYPAPDENPGPRDNDKTIDYLNEVAASEKLDLTARLMPNVVISQPPDYVVREAPGYCELHTKGMIVDGARTLVSSINGTQAALLRNREAAVIVDNAAFAAYFTAVFDYDWGASEGQSQIQRRR